MSEAARKLQVIPHREHRDHIPTHCSFHYTGPWHAHADKGINWDHDKIAMCHTKWLQRRECTLELNSDCADLEERKIVQMIQNVAKNFFMKGLAGQPKQRWQ